MQLPPKRRRRFRRRKRDPASASNVVSAALQKMGLTDQARRLRIMGAWAEAVGPNIAAKTMPHSFSRGVLTVKTESAAWQNELTFLKGDLIERVNATLGKAVVKDLKVMSGRVTKPTIHRERPRWLREPPVPADLEAVRQTAAVIEDPELRRAFAQVMELHQRARRILQTDSPEIGYSPPKRGR